MGARLTGVASRENKGREASGCRMRAALSCPGTQPARSWPCLPAGKGILHFALASGQWKGKLPDGNNKSIILSLVLKVRYGNWHGRCVPLSMALCKVSCMGWEHRTREGTS